MFSPFLGKVYEIENLNRILVYYNDQLIISYYDDICKIAANSIMSGKIIGWFQNESEVGPRALGNRSILADPRNPQMKDILNKKVKFRESFRPFAPAVLWEYQKEYFNIDIPSLYMLMISDVLPEKQLTIPAVTHVDGTARLQTVQKELCPIFYNLIYEFYKITNIPMVINTSFNLKGEPIVERPEDAVECFLNTNIDELYIGNYLFIKK
jgi:carbamoyltransferase